MEALWDLAAWWHELQLTKQIVFGPPDYLMKWRRHAGGEKDRVFYGLFG